MQRSRSTTPGTRGGTLGEPYEGNDAAVRVERVPGEFKQLARWENEGGAVVERETSARRAAVPTAALGGRAARRA
jgi:hypothetical protein